MFNSAGYPTTASIYLETVAHSRYLEEVKDYIKVPPYGGKRSHHYTRWLHAKERILVYIIGNYSDMGSYIEEYYREV